MLTFHISAECCAAWDKVQARRINTSVLSAEDSGRFTRRSTAQQSSGSSRFNVTLCFSSSGAVSLLDALHRLSHSKNRWIQFVNTHFTTGFLLTYWFKRIPRLQIVLWKQPGKHIWFKLRRLVSREAARSPFYNCKEEATPSYSWVSSLAVSTIVQKKRKEQKMA